MHASAILKLFAALVAAASPAVAELAVTSPVGTTTCTAGQSCSVAWNDNGQGVTLAQQGNCTVALYTGNQQQQTFLQPIAFPQAINVASTAAIEFIPDATVGENDNHYFIRFSSTTLTQNSTTGAATTNPYLSFSAKFTLTGMTGTFNSTVKAQIAGITSSAGGATATGATSTAAATTTGTRGTSSTRSASSSTATHTGAASHNAGASGLVAAGALFAGVVALF